MNRNRLFLITIIFILLLSTSGLVYYFVTNNSGEQATIEFESPVVEDIIKKSVATGTIRPRREVNIKPQVSGVVETFFVEAGELVKKGQEIARIKLVPSEVSINDAQSSVELARLRLKNAKRELDRQKKVYEKQLDVQDAQASLDNAKTQEQRFRELFEEGVISEQEYQQYQLDFQLAQTRFDNARIVARNNLRQFENEVDIREQELEAAVNNLQLLREGASRKSRQVANVITSTVEGMVLDLPIEEGSSVIERNNFNEGTTIATVADMNALVFEGKVDESDVGKLKEGMPLELTVGAIDDQQFGAVLEFISPKGIEEEGTVKFEIRAALETPEEVFLRAGYSANADIILDKRQQVLAVKERDVLFEEEQTFVELRQSGDQVQKQEVTLGISDGILVEVIKGLDENAQVKVQRKR